MKKPKAPPPPDPAAIIRAQTQANRVNINTPFGSQQYETGPNGQTALNTTLSPAMAQLAERAMSLAGQDSQRFQAPPGLENILGGVMNKLGDRYGQAGAGASVTGSGGRKPAQPMAMAKPLAIPAAGAGAPAQSETSSTPTAAPTGGARPAFKDPDMLMGRRPYNHINWNT